ncbi:molybdopterin dinucleotide-binding protein [Gordonibacter sp. 28C]|uniref:molybdopterin-dependent oxidoreductase n=1 Tax=Gordonibacter sp. 28C TaxID=2078569 RepID=UPI000DF78EE0|nr:molybdopterin-dependent oxidoreductase [Gordonibacter sp. 28C]RDB62038.1 molybdopterin dinucleotide-binding protein [Gordonibacter sp. 28C]
MDQWHNEDSRGAFGTPSRRAVVGASAAVALGALAGGAGLGAYMASNDPLTDSPHGRGRASDAYGADDVVLSMCNNCNTYCTIKVRVADAAEGAAAAEGATALVRKISGNPYSPLNSQPYAPVSYGTAPVDALAPDGSMAVEGRATNGGMICLKGQAGIQLAHDALRVTQPLRRVGGRGSDEWETVSWDEAVDEIVNGSPSLGTPGVAEWWAYAPKKDVEADVALVEAGEMAKDAFAQKWADKLIDVEHPDLGPKSNLFCSCGGDRMFLIGDRFTQKCFGSVNNFNHGGVCGMTGVMGNARTHPTTGHKRMYADIDHCECLIIWGTEPMTANKGPTWLAPRLSVARERGMKLVVVDPRQGRSASKADVWLPVVPGHDADLAFAMASWIVQNERYDEAYLRAPGKKAAAALGEPTWSDATHLVAVDLPNRPVVTAKLLGRSGEGGLADDARFVFAGGELVAADELGGPADLEVDGVVDVKGKPTRVASVFALLKERLAERTIEEYAAAAGIDVADVVDVAREFTSHGKRACVMSYRGPAMHANGYDAVRAVSYLNFLIGNHDWKGGHIAAAAKFAPYTGRYDLQSVPNAHEGWGIPITRQKTEYEKTSYFKQDGYPAPRPWYPLPGNLSHEIVPTLRAGYVYDHLGALFIHRHSLVDSTPGGDRMADVLCDTDKINLLVSFDVEVGDTSRYADFVLPDRTYLERFSQEPIYPNQQYQLIQFGQPAIRAYEGPRSVEDVYLEIMERLGLPGVGEGAVPKGKKDSGQTAPLSNEQDYWLKMAANIAYAGEPVPDADAEELALFERVRARALGDAFDLDAWKAAVDEDEWPKVVYVLNRGGRFGSADPAKDDGYEGDLIKTRYAGLCTFYDPKTASTKNALTGKNFDGLAAATPVAYADGSAFEAPAERPLAFVNWKARTNGTHRTIASPWLRETGTENFVWMCPADAAVRGLANGDAVKVAGPMGSESGHVRVTEGIRPGVVGCNFSFGQTGYRARPLVVDGEVLAPAPDYLEESGVLDGDVPGKQKSGYAGGRGRGLIMNELLPDDPTVQGGGGVCDPVGGGSAQLDLFVEVRKA